MKIKSKDTYDNSPEINGEKVPKITISNIDPTIYDDSDSGFYVGCQWFNTGDSRNFLCNSATTSAATWVRVDNADLFYIGVNFELSGITWNYVAPEPFKINTVNNPDSLSYDIIHNGTAYTLTNSIALYDDISITGTTSTGFLKLNSELL